MKLNLTPMFLALAFFPLQAADARSTRLRRGDAAESTRTTNRCGNWMPTDSRALQKYVGGLKKNAVAKELELVEPVWTLQEMVRQDRQLNFMANEMFRQASAHTLSTPLGMPQVTSFDEFIVVLNHIVTSVAPEYTLCEKNNKAVSLEPCGLVGFPLNAVLDWPMATEAGYNIFSNQLFNQQLKKALNYWTSFLASPNSTFVLTDSNLDQTPPSLAWLSLEARENLVFVANNATGALIKPSKFEEVFEANPNNGDTWGFNSWDEFFIRTFRPEVRPVEDPDDQSVIVSACESAPLQVATDVQLDAKFWLKGQPCSLQNMLAFHRHSNSFIGGTVYQAFLSALSYHRWHAPVDGTIVDTLMVDGTYYLENLSTGFKGTNPDAAGPNDSQPFLSAVATRAIVFIEADNPDIGLMAFVAIGMAEVSSCDITVNVGQHVTKGNELGMFHFGGSTHALVFNKDVQLEFIDHVNENSGLDATNIAVNSKIARVL